MTSNQPYLLRAFYEWIVDNENTPYLLVDALHPGTEVPQAFVEDGNIVLNVAPHACGDFVASNDSVTFNARFQGRVQQVYLPIASIQAIYSKETGDGTLFESPAISDGNIEEIVEVADVAKPVQQDEGKESKSHLKLVK